MNRIWRMRHDGQWGTWGEATERRLVEASAVWMFGFAGGWGRCAAMHLFLLATGKGGGR